jgi:hypothetical protein
LAEAALVDVVLILADADRTLLFSGSGQDSGGNGATDDGATCGLMPDCGLVVPIGAHAGAALVSRKT